MLLKNYLFFTMSVAVFNQNCSQMYQIIVFNLNLTELF